VRVENLFVSSRNPVVGIKDILHDFN